MPTASFRTLTISYHDESEYKTLIDEVFKRRSYYFESATDTPLIIDAGAHIGMSLLYFHTLYPRSRKICIEPNPQNLKYLQENIELNDVQNVTVIPKALVGKHGAETVPLYTNNQWTVFSSLQPGGWTGHEDGEPVDVPTIRLSELITEPVDLLKLDIEGMETEVLEEAKDTLPLVEHLIMEFHETPSHQDGPMIKLLEKYFTRIERTVDGRREKHRGNQLLMIEAWK